MHRRSRWRRDVLLTLTCLRILLMLRLVRLLWVYPHSHSSLHHPHPTRRYRLCHPCSRRRHHHLLRRRPLLWRLLLYRLYPSPDRTTHPRRRRDRRTKRRIQRRNGRPRVLLRYGYGTHTGWTYRDTDAQ